MAALQLVVLWKTLPAALWRNDCRSWCDIVIRVSATVTKGKTSEVKQSQRRSFHLHFLELCDVPALNPAVSWAQVGGGVTAQRWWGCTPTLISSGDVGCPSGFLHYQLHGTSCMLTPCCNSAIIQGVHLPVT